MLRRMRSDRSFGRTGEGGGGGGGAGGGESDRSWPRAWLECEQQPSFATRGISRLEVASEYLAARLSPIILIRPTSSVHCFPSLPAGMGPLPDSGSSAELGTQRGDPERGLGASGHVTATLHKLGGSNRMPVTLDLDASIGQLLARMKPLLQEEEWQLYQTRGVIVLSGDKPQSWTLDHSYTKFMACPSVQERIKAGVGLHFILHLEDVHSNQGWPCQGVHLEVPPRPHLKALKAIPHQNLEPSSRKKTINALNLEPLTTYVRTPVGNRQSVRTPVGEAISQERQVSLRPRPLGLVRVSALGPRA